MTRSTTMTPMMFEHQLVERARSDRKHIVLPEGDDDRILEAADRLLRRNVVDLTILGRPDALAERARQLGLDIAAARIIDPETDRLREVFAADLVELRRSKGLALDAAYDQVADVSYFGTMMVWKGLADGMVSGAAHTTAHTDPTRAADHQDLTGRVDRVQRLLHGPGGPRPGLRRLRHQPVPGCHAAGGHRDLVGGDRPGVRRGTPDRDAQLLDGRIRFR